MSFEKRLQSELLRHLQSRDAIDARFPSCPDVADKWESIGTSYLVDGVREFAAYPEAVLGWMMYIGMAVAKFWDLDWPVYSRVEDLYAHLRDKRGYDALDESVLDDVLLVRGAERARVESLVSDCAVLTHDLLRHEGIEHGTPEAFKAFVACLRQLYIMGAAVQLKRMGYHMSKM